MPRIPGVPNLDPVNLPTMSPQEASIGAEAVSRLGSEANESVLSSFDLEMYIKKAQQHIDSLAAQNELSQVYVDTQNQLSKTQNSRDIDGVIQSGNQNLNDVSKRWSTSPAAIQIQQSADSLRPDLSRIGTVRQVDLMGKEFKITLDQQAEVLAGSYAQDRASGGSGNMALGAFSEAVRGGVQTGLVGDVEAGEYVRQFRQKGQELQIKNGISNANPEVNQRIYDDISKHRDLFPDVTQEQLDVFKGQALSAFEAHTKFQDWSEEQMALKTQLVPKINQFTNPATGRFDEGAALKDNAERIARGEITETQSGILAQGFASHEAQLNVGYKQQAEKTKNDIVELFHKRNYSKASTELEQHKLDPGFEDMYEGLTKYGDSMRREDRAEYRAARSFELQQEQDNSNRTFSSLLGNMAHGQIYTDSQLMNLVNGKGSVKPGQMRWQEAQEAMGAMRKYESDPQFQAAVKMLDDGFPEAEQTRKQRLSQTHMSQQGKQAEQSEINARIEDRKSLTFKAWQARINQNPNEDKISAMKAVMEPQIQQQISQQIDAAFGTQQAAPSRGILDMFRSSGTAREGATKTNSAGDKLKFTGGKWVLQP